MWEKIADLVGLVLVVMDVSMRLVMVICQHTVIKSMQEGNISLCRPLMRQCKEDQLYTVQRL